MKRYKELARPALAVLAAALLVACGARDVNKTIAASKVSLANGEARAAVIELKAALQDSPSSAEVRFLLGQALFESGDAPSALIELRKALELGLPKASGAPVLARVMLAVGQPKKIVEELADLRIEDAQLRADLDTSLSMAYMLLGDKVNSDKRLDAALSGRPDFPDAVVVQARARLRDGDRVGAVKALEAVLAKAATNTDARLLLGDIKQYALNDPTGAIAEYQAATTAKPDMVRAHVALINLYWDLNKRDEAKAQLTKLQAVQPNNFRTKFIEAQFAAVDKNFAKARDLANVLLAVAPGYVELLNLLGTVESALGNQRQAATHLSKALFIAPGRVDIRNTLGETYLRSGQYERANEVVRNLVTPESKDPRALSVAAQAQFRLGKFAEARDLFQRASKVRPDDVGIQTSLAQLDFANGESERAVVRLQDLSANDKGGLADQALIALQLRQKDYDAALKSIAGLAAKGVDPALPAMLRGQVEALRGDRIAARQQFEQALATSASNAAAVKALADLDNQEGKGSAAIARYEALLKASPDNAEGMAELARMRARAGAAKEQVVAGLSQAIKTEPQDARFRLMLVDFYASTNDKKAAVLAAQDAVAAMPNSDQVLMALGAAQLNAGDTQQALGTYRKLIQTQPRSPEGYLRMAEAWLVANDKTSAEASLRQALTVAPDSAKAQRQLAELLVRNGRPDSAVALAKTVQRQSPKDAGGYLLEAEIQAYAKHQEAAISALRAGLKATGASDAAQALYRALVNAGKSQDASRLVDDWMKRNPRDAAFLRAAADVDMRGHHYAAAEQHFGMLAAFDPKDASALNNMAWLRLKLGKRGALALAERAVALNGNNAAYLDTQAHALLAEKQLPQAVKTSRRVIELQPTDVALRFSSAEVMALAGEGAMAEETLAPLTKGSTSGFTQGEIKRIRALTKR